MASDSGSEKRKGIGSVKSGSLPFLDPIRGSDSWIRFAGKAGHVITPEEYIETPERPPEFFAEGMLYRYGKPVKTLKHAKSSAAPHGLLPQPA